MTGAEEPGAGPCSAAQPINLRVVRTDDGHRLDGDGPITVVANRYLAHLGSRAFSQATVQAYAFDLLNFSRFLAERGAALVKGQLDFRVGGQLISLLADRRIPCGRPADLGVG